MITLYPYEELGHANYGWLDARHHFSFAEYRDPNRVHFGKLRVINDDVIKAGAGFEMHPHENMEIITFVREGAITHRDSKGNEGRTTAGNVQVMSAGSGLFHSEYNLESEDTSLFQIWIFPKEKGIKPRWDMATFSDRKANGKLPLLVSGRTVDKDQGALYIHQDASISGGLVEAGHELVQPIVDQAYILVSDGEIEVDGQLMTKGDGLEVKDQDSVTLKAINDAEVIMIDVPL